MKSPRYWATVFLRWVGYQIGYGFTIGTNDAAAKIGGRIPGFPR